MHFDMRTSPRDTHCVSHAGAQSEIDIFVLYHISNWNLTYWNVSFSRLLEGLSQRKKSPKQLGTRRQENNSPGPTCGELLLLLWEITVWIAERRGQHAVNTGSFLSSVHRKITAHRCYSRILFIRFIGASAHARL